MTVCVADTNVIGFPTPRRFLSGLSVELGHPFFVPPTIVLEAVHTIRRAEERFWLKKMETQTLSPRVKSAVFAAVGSEVEDWAKELLLSDQGWLRPTCTSTSTKINAVNLSQEIPLDAFTDTRPNKHENDVAIVCESIAGGADMLITANMETMDHVTLNRWLMGSGFRNIPLLHSPDMGIAELLGAQKIESVHVTAITMGLSHAQRSEQDEHDSLMKFTEGLRMTFPNIRSTIRNEELRSDDTAERWAKARSNLKLPEWQQVRASEENRISRTQAAARAAGFDHNS